MSATKDAFGFCVAEGLTKISAIVKYEMFDALKIRALKDNKTMAEKIREYVEVGLEVDDSWDDDRTRGVEE